MEQAKRVIEWQPKRAEKRTASGSLVPGEYVGKFRTKVPEGTPSAVRNKGKNEAGVEWDFWEIESDSIAGKLRWIDKRDGGDYKTKLVLFLETDKTLHQLVLPYDGFTLKDVVNHLAGSRDSLATQVFNISYWVRKDLDKDKRPKLDVKGKQIWKKSVSFRDCDPLYSYEQWMDFAPKNDLLGFHKKKADGSKEWVDDASIKYWDSILVRIQKALLKTDDVLPFTYNSLTVCEAPNPSGGGNLTPEEIELAARIYESKKGMYRFSYQKSSVDADTALAAMGVPTAAPSPAFTRQEPDLIDSFSKADASFPTIEPINTRVTANHEIAEDSDLPF